MSDAMPSAPPAGNSAPPSNGYSPVRTLAVRLTEDVRAQLDVIAQLTGRTVTEEIRLAIEHWIDKTKSDPKTQARAEAVRAEIEREAATRRNAIAAIFDGGKGNDKPVAKKVSGSSSTGSSGAAARPQP